MKTDEIMTLFCAILVIGGALLETDSIVICGGICSMMLWIILIDDYYKQIMKEKPSVDRRF